MSKVSTEHVKAELKREIKELEKDKAAVYQNNSDREEAACQAQEIVRRIRLKSRQLDELNKRGANGTYALAQIIISHNDEKDKEVLAVIKDHSVPETIATETYVISYETDLAKAIIAAKSGGLATYEKRGIKTCLRVLNYEQKKNFPEE